MFVERQEKRGEPVVFYKESTVRPIIKNLKDQEDTLGCREAAALTRQVGRNQGIEISEKFYGTFSLWTTLTFAQALETKQPEIFSPTALALRGETGRRFTYRLTITDIKTIFKYGPCFSQKGIPLEKQYQEAREKIYQRWEKNVNLNQVAKDLLGSSYREQREKLEKLLWRDNQPGDLSLGNYPFLYANTIGLPQEVYQELKPTWQQKLKEGEEKRKSNLRSSRRIQVMKEEGEIYFMGSFLKELFELKKTSKHTRLAAFYLKKELKPFGIPIEIIRRANRIFYYCLIRKDEAKELERFFQQSTEEARRIRAKTKDILQNGFQTLREFQEYCPSDYLISLTQTLRLSSIFVSNFVISSIIKKIEECFASFGLEVEQVTLGLDKKTGQPRRSYYLSLQDLQELPGKKRIFKKRLMSLTRAKVLME